MTGLLVSFDPDFRRDSKIGEIGVQFANGTRGRGMEPSNVRMASGFGVTIDPDFGGGTKLVTV